MILMSGFGGDDDDDDDDDDDGDEEEVEMVPEGKIFFPLPSYTISRLLA